MWVSVARKGLRGAVSFSFLSQLSTTGIYHLSSTGLLHYCFYLGALYAALGAAQLVGFVFPGLLTLLQQGLQLFLDPSSLWILSRIEPLPVPVYSEDILHHLNGNACKSRRLQQIWA